MSITVRNLKYDYNRRVNSHELRVYIDDTPLHKIADKWFDENNIMSLRVRSRSWNAIVRHLNNILIPKISSHFEVVSELCTWSQKCGCSCGCSPGFKVKGVKFDFQRKDAWAKVEVKDHEVNFFQSLMNSDKIKKLLQKDIEKHEQALAEDAKKAE